MDREVTRNIGKISIITIVSRIFGFFRDMLFAFVFGTSFFSDAFILAFRIPNSLRLLLGEGSLNAAFIPVFSGVIHKSDKDRINRTASRTFTALTLILILICVIGILFSKQIIQLFTFSFGTMGQKEVIAFKILRIMFPYALFICIAALSMGILNSLKVFHIPAFMPIVYSITIIFSLLVGHHIYGNDVVKIMFLVAYGVVLAGLLEFLFQQPFIRKKGVKLKFDFNFRDPNLKKIVRLMVPAVLGQTVFELSSLVDAMLAWMLGAGAVASLYFANRIMQLSHGVFGIAIATVTLPILSYAVAKKNNVEFNEKLFYSIRLLFLIMLPIIIIITLNAKEIITIIYKRGSFTNESVNMTYLPLVLYSCGLVFYSGVKIMAMGFYAHQNTKTPVAIASFCFILNVLLNMIFMNYLAHAGLALATCISAGVNFTLLSINLRKYYIHDRLKRVLQFVMKLIFSAVITFLVVFFINRFLQPFNLTGEFLSSLLKLLISSVSTGILYIIISLLLGINIIKYIKVGLFGKKKV